MKRLASVRGSVLLGIVAACTVFAGTESHSATAQDVSSQGAKYAVHTWPLPDNNTGDVSMDYIAYDLGTNSVWVPGGNTAAVDVVDAAKGTVRQIPGFPTSEVDVRGGEAAGMPPQIVVVQHFDEELKRLVPTK
jgi:hypothetical protein